MSLYKSKIEITDSLDTNIEYTGAVSISYIDKKTGKSYLKNKYNQSENALFTALCRCLSGYNTANYIPRYLKAYTVVANEANPNKEAFIQKVPYSATPVLYKRNDSSWVRSTEEDAQMVEYTFIIPSNAIKFFDTDHSIKSLKLFNELGKECASVNLTDDKGDGVQPSSSSNILITWRLFFSNTKN